MSGHSRELPLHGAYTGTGGNSERVVVVPQNVLQESGELVPDINGDIRGLRIHGHIAPSHWFRNGIIGATLCSVVAGVLAVTGIADPGVEAARKMLGTNKPSFPPDTAGPLPGAAQTSPDATPSPRKTPKATITPSPTKTAEPTKTPEQCMTDFSTQRLAGSSLLLSMRVSEDKKENTLEKVAKVYNANSIGGVVIAGGSLDADYNQGNTTLADFTATQTVPMVVAVTFEGGKIVRVPLPESVGVLPSQPEVAKMDAKQLKAFDSKLDAVYADFAAHGITMVFGPDVDLAKPSKAGPMKGRTFSSDPELVAELATRYAKIAEKHDLKIIFKHAAGGLGTAHPYSKDNGGNTDQGAVYTENWSVIGQDSLIPYQAAKGMENVGVMMGTQTIPGLTTDDKAKQMPAAFSKNAVDTIKNAIDSDSTDPLIVTDDIRTKTVSDAGYTVPEAVLAALKAGNNYIEIGSPMRIKNEKSWQKTLDAIIEAVDAEFKADPTFRNKLQQQVLTNLIAKGVDPCTIT